MVGLSEDEEEIQSLEQGWFLPEACFAVSRDLLLRPSKARYEEMIRAVGRENDPVEAHAIERLWPDVFGSR